MKHLFTLACFSILFSTALFAKNSDTYFFVFLNTNPDKEVISEDSAQQLQKAHLANIDRLYKKGKIVAAGPFDGGGGLFIFKTKNMEETQSLLNTDPEIKAKRWKLEIFPMNILKGNICKHDKEYKMGSYVFVRFVKDPHDASLNTIKLLSSKERIEFLKNPENKILFSAAFGKKSGGFQIISTDETGVAEEIMKNDPTVKNTQLLYSSKVLWIAKGTFCE